MSLDIPASLARELERFAEAERISPAEAATRLIKQGLVTKKRAAKQPPLTEAEWERLRADPVFSFFENLPDSVMDSIEKAYKESRSERARARV